MGSKLLYSLPALILALLALILAIVGLSQNTKPQKAAAVQADIVQRKADEHRYWIITQPLNDGDALSTDKLAVVSSPTAIPDAIGADQNVAGRKLQRYARPGEMLTKDFFEPGGSLPSSLPEGRRAMAISVDDVVGAGGLLQPDDRVDVVTAFRHSGENNSPSAMVMLHDIPVLAVRGSLSRQGDQKDQNRRRNNTVVLSVPEKKVPALMLASSEGKLRLAVVGRNDSDNPAVSGQSVPATNKSDDNTLAKGDAVASSDSRTAGKTSQDDGKPFYFDDFFPAEHKKTARSAPRRPRGHRVQVFEGSKTRSTYVQ